MPHATDMRCRRSMRLCPVAVAVALLFSLYCTVVDATSIGAVYGRNGDNIPPPLTAAGLMHQYTITRVRIYDHDVNVIQAFATTQIRVMIAVTNDEILGVAGTQSVADTWVSVNVAPYIKTVNINAIAVGSEVLTSTNLSAQLVPAMTNIHTALTKQGFDQSVKVSSPHGLGLLEISYPPSSGVYFATYVGVLQPMLDFLAQTGSFFMLNAYPFRAYESNILAVNLNYALFNTSTGVRDTNTGLQYYSLYDAQIDALISAMSQLNHSTLPIVVTETGWPSEGDASEPAANYQDAETYNTNLVANTLNNSGTPLRPGQEIDAYIVSLYDEDLNPLPVSNQHWGLFYVNGTSKYGINFATANWNTGGNNGSSNSSSNSTAPPPPPASGGTPSPSSSNVWCVAKSGSTNASLQQGLDWACGPGRAECSPIQSGGSCYLPNTVMSHASYAFNIHYHFFQSDPRSCIFGGDATLTNVDPSYGTCYYVPSHATGLRGSVLRGLLFVAVGCFTLLIKV